MALTLIQMWNVVECYSCSRKYIAQIITAVPENILPPLPKRLEIPEGSGIKNPVNSRGGGPGFKSSSLPLDGFVFGSPEFNSSAYHQLYLLCLICIIFVCYGHLNISTWNLRDINVYYYYYRLDFYCHERGAGE